MANPTSFHQSIIHTVKSGGLLACVKEKGHLKPAIVISRQAWLQGEEMWKLGKILQIEMGAYLLGRRKNGLIFVDQYVFPEEHKILSLKPEIAKTHADFIRDAVMGKMESILKCLQDKQEIFSNIYREKFYTNPQIAHLNKEQFLTLEWEAVGLPFVLDLTFNFESRVQKEARDKGLRIIGHAHSHTLTTGGRFYFGVDDYREAEKANTKESFDEAKMHESIKKQLSPSPHELRVIHESIFQLDGANPKSMPSAQFLHFNPQVFVYRMTLDIAEKYAESASETFLEAVTCQIEGDPH